MAILLAIASALMWGGADFFGGSAARRLKVLVVTFASQGAGLVSVVLLFAVVGAPFSFEGAIYGAAAGIVGAVALSVFYAALAAGVMSLVAPLSALGAVVPVSVALAEGARLEALAVVGMAVTLAGVVLIARREPGAPALTRRVLGLAAGAALGIGTVLTLFQLGTDVPGSSGLGVVAAARTASITVTGLAILATRTSLAMTRPQAGRVALVGVADTGANAMFAVASETGPDALVAVLGSLYPVTTVLLARAFLAERLTRRQAAGVALALSGAALLSSA
jgi:drug/metabolite transporter (DMT)-like permease